MKSVEECILTFLEQVEIRKNVDYCDRTSIRRYNSAYDKAFKCVKYIDDYHPNNINTLMELLRHPDCDVVLHCAPMILRLSNSTTEHKEQAIAAIYRTLEDPRVDDLTKLGFTMSLKQWEEEIYDRGRSGPDS